ncbi:MAG: alanine dehydrogenase [Candidatus Hydrogenedentota bacterium]|nr:MAG: alanine dehydrogenase [Candidatus Hydrogenedentota bacterium]
MKNEVLFLSGRTISRLFSMREAIRIIERAFHNHALGRIRMPPKVYLDLPEYDGDFRAMPAFSKPDRAAGVKWVNSHPGNAERGLPTVMAVYILNDPITAVPFAVMDGTVLTRMRTGAAGGVAARHLAQRNIRVAAFIGAGVQAMMQIEALAIVRKVTMAKVFDPSPEAVAGFRRRARRLGVKTVAVESPEEAVAGADIIVTTTPSTSPVIEAEWVSPGTHINAIGADAPGKQELDPALLGKARIIVDDPIQASHSGEVNVPLREGLLPEAAINTTLGEVVAGLKPGRRDADEITIFDSTGLAVQDVAAASFIYRKAIKEGRGRKLRLF